MKPFLLFAAGLALWQPVSAQVFSWTRDQMIRYTPENPFERFADGRPKVPDALLERVKTMSMEEAWGELRSKGYINQYVEGFQTLRPGQKLVGRAFTAQYVPMRPDFTKVVDGDAKAKGMASGVNQRVIDQLGLNDVPVVDLMGAAPGHNFGGDNLQTAIWAATHTGAVVDGTVRDLDGLAELPTQIFFRAAHPAAVTGVSILGINIPVHIGNALVMPGDVVLGDREGIVFIPPHLVQEIVEKAEVTHIHDEWTREKFLTGKYKASEVYPTPTIPELKKEYDEYLKKRLAEKRKQ